MTLARRVFLVALLLSAAACGDLLDSVAPFPATPIPVDLSLTIAEPPDDLPPYDRDEWRHWVDDDGDCQDTRQEVLVAESKDRVTYRDDRRCSVEAGRWLDPYTGAAYTDPRDLDIDHLVPLANAHRSGGWAWSAERKRQFANSLGDDAHLIAVTALVNREKGAKGPEEWRPPDESYWCEYASSWAGVKQTWGLTATHAEAIALRDMLKTCDGPVNFEAAGEALVAQPAAPQPIGTYASCDEAAAAGEPRVKGGVGEGWGFPASLLPNNRDGDGDGVVCEVAPPADALPTATLSPSPPPAETPTPATSAATPTPARLYRSCAEAEAAGEERVKGAQGEGWGFSIILVMTAQDGDNDGVVCEIPDPGGLQPQTYASCAEADAGEEARVKGDSGNGRGFPAAMVPSAQDGDGDGVVCESQGGLVIIFASPTAVPPAPSPSPTAAATPKPSTARTYASCDEAEAAGEERVQGSIGEGWGFPAELVPGARDGDGDGVVCEVRQPASSSSPPGPTPTPTVAPDRDGTYASCDDAEAAGEPRVQGSSGPGRGFPAELVPSARDGDGDGVVCEE